MVRIRSHISLLAILASFLPAQAIASSLCSPINSPHQSGGPPSILSTRIETVINTSFVLQPGERIGPPDNSTYYHHTRILGKSILMGKVSIEGAPIYFTANGYNTRNLERILINQTYSFTINPADDLYWFIFDNTANDEQSLVQFELIEKYTSLFLVAVPIVTATSLFATALLIGLVLRKRRR